MISCLFFLADVVPAQKDTYFYRKELLQEMQILTFYGPVQSSAEK